MSTRTRIGVIVNVAAGGAHCDADIGGGESRCVVDAVTDHCDWAVTAEQFDGGEFVVGEQFGAEVLDTCCRAMA